MVTLGAIYLTVQIVRQIPLTPGGLGVIEISLLAGLVSAGAGEAAAAATVLVYRLLSCWLIIPVGLLGWLLLRRPPHARPSLQAGNSRVCRAGDSRVPSGGLAGLRSRRWTRGVTRWVEPANSAVASASTAAPSVHGGRG